MTNTLYTHYSKKGLYTVLFPCQYQHNNVWYDAISYVDVETNKIYVRESEDFDNSFKVVED